MKNTTFAKTALSTLVVLALTACTHNSPEKNYQPTTKVIKKANTAVNMEANTSKLASKDDIKAISDTLKKIQTKVNGLSNTKTDNLAVKDDIAKLSDTLKNIQDKIKNVGTLTNTDTKQLTADVAKIKAEIAKLANLKNSLGTDDTKSVQAKLNDLQEAVGKITPPTPAEQKKKEEQLKKEKLNEDFATLPFSIETNLEKIATEGKSRKEFQAIFNSKFDWKKVFEGETKVDDNSITSVKGNGVAGNVVVDGHSLNITRHDLKYSKVADISEVIDTYDYKDQDDNPVTSSSSSAVFAIAGKPTDLDKVTFDELKAQNKGNLIYKGKATHAVHHINTQDYKDVDKPKPLENMDIMAQGGLTGGWKDVTFTVNLEKKKISGYTTFNGSVPLKVKFDEGNINVNDNTKQLEFSGDISAEQEKSKTEYDYWDKKDVTYTTKHYLKKDGKQEGNYNGVFMGPNAEELAGMFEIKQNYVRDDTKNSKNGKSIPGKTTTFGNINGAFNAKKVRTEGDYTFKK